MASETTEPVGVRRCTERTPRSLVGNLRPLQCTMRCDASGRHGGKNHRASWTMMGVGKIVVKWKQKRNPPPEITLPAARIERKRGPVQLW